MRPSFVLLQWHSCCHGDCWTRPLLPSDVLVRATPLHLLSSSEVSQNPLCDSRSFRHSYGQPRGRHLPRGNARLREKGGAQVWDRHPAGHAWPGLGWLPAHRTSPSRLAAQMDHGCVDGCHRKQTLQTFLPRRSWGSWGQCAVCAPLRAVCEQRLPEPSGTYGAHGPPTTESPFAFPEKTARHRRSH